MRLITSHRHYSSVVIIRYLSGLAVYDYGTFTSHNKSPGIFDKLIKLMSASVLYLIIYCMLVFGREKARNSAGTANIDVKLQNKIHFCLV